MSMSIMKAMMMVAAAFAAGLVYGAEPDGTEWQDWTRMNQGREKTRAAPVLRRRSGRMARLGVQLLDGEGQSLRTGEGGVNADRLRLYCAYGIPLIILSLFVAGHLRRFG